MFGADMQCTVVLRNIACKLTPAMVKDVLDEAGLQGTFAFVCVPCIPSGRSNLGYAFIGFRSANHAASCRLLFEGKVFGRTSSVKICEVELANEEKGSRALAQMCRRQRHGRQLGLLVCDEPVAWAPEPHVALNPASPTSEAWPTKRVDRSTSIDSEGSTTGTATPSNREASTPWSSLACPLDAPCAIGRPSPEASLDHRAIRKVLEHLVADYLRGSTLLGHLPGPRSLEAETPLGRQTHIGDGKAQPAGPPGLGPAAFGPSFPDSSLGASVGHVLGAQLSHIGEMLAPGQWPQSAGHRPRGHGIGDGHLRHDASLEMAASHFGTVFSV